MGLACATIIAGCASNPRGDLERGVCPSYIVFPGERTQMGRERYGDSTTESQLAGYRDREVANCEQHLTNGDATALAVLLEYWYSQSNPGQVAAVYKTYLENGRDERLIADVAEGRLVPAPGDLVAPFQGLTEG